MLDGVKSSSHGLTFPEILIATCAVIFVLFIAAAMLVPSMSDGDSDPRSKPKMMSFKSPPPLPPIRRSTATCLPVPMGQSIELWLIY